MFNVLAYYFITYLERPRYSSEQQPPSLLKIPELAPYMHEDIMQVEYWKLARLSDDCAVPDIQCTGILVK